MFEGKNQSLVKLFQSFDNAMSTNPEEVGKRNESLYLPTIDSEIFQNIFESVRNQLYTQQSVQYIDPPCVVFGDLHGHFLDLVRIINVYGFPKDRKFVFLGDMIDRGEFSVETIAYIFLLKYFYRDNVVIIRGNHEFQSTYMRHGFSKDIKKYSLNEEAITAMNITFEYLPFACIIGNKFICVHGGIGPETTLEDIKSVRLPYKSSDDNGVISDVLWSDPTNDTKDFHKSPRGKGFLYGENVLNRFLDQSGLKILIRAHEMIKKGVDEFFGGRLLSVFSASNYCGVYNNSSGAIIIKEDLSFDKVILKPLSYLLRAHAFKLEDLTMKRMKSFVMNKGQIKFGSGARVNSVNSPESVKKGEKRTSLPIGFKI